MGVAVDMFVSGDLSTGGDLSTAADLGSASDSGSTSDAVVADAGEAVTSVSCEGVTPISTVHAGVGPGFVAANIGVSPGDIVKWTNDDAFPHTVTADAFDAALPASASVCLRFNTVATHAYHCSIHSSMTGSVTVTD